MVGMRERCTLTAKATPMQLCANKGVARRYYSIYSMPLSLPCLSLYKCLAPKSSMGNTRISSELRVPFADRV